MSDAIQVGFDAFYFSQPMTGTGQYATNLWRELVSLLGVDNTFLLAPDDFDPAPSGIRSDQVITSSIPDLPPRIRKIWWEQVGLTRATQQSNADVVHIPYWAAPVLKGRPLVVTIHDVIPMVLPEYAGSSLMRAYLKWNAATARSADLILTDSEHSRNDIHRELGISLDRIRSIPLAAGDEYHPVQSEADEQEVRNLRDRYGLERPFVLHVGGWDRRKRLPDVVAAFALANAQVGNQYDLVIAGNPHTANRWLYPSIDNEIRRWGIADRVRLTGFVPGGDMAVLYRAADVFVFGSEYEGFGLDPLEAMATGLPVVCSNRASLPEVVGEAGVLVDPNPRSLAKGLVRVMGDETLRTELSQRGRERAGGFSWRRTAELTLEAYQDVLNERGG